MWAEAGRCSAALRFPRLPAVGALPRRCCHPPEPPWPTGPPRRDSAAVPPPGASPPAPRDSFYPPVLPCPASPQCRQRRRQSPKHPGGTLRRESAGRGRRARATCVRPGSPVIPASRGGGVPRWGGGGGGRRLWLWDRERAATGTGREQARRRGSGDARGRSQPAPTGPGRASRAGRLPGHLLGPLVLTVPAAKLQARTLPRTHLPHPCAPNTPARPLARTRPVLPLRSRTPTTPTHAPNMDTETPSSACSPDRPLSPTVLSLSITCHIQHPPTQRCTGTHHTPAQPCARPSLAPPIICIPHRMHTPIECTPPSYAPSHRMHPTPDRIHPPSYAHLHRHRWSPGKMGMVGNLHRIRPLQLISPGKSRHLL